MPAVNDVGKPCAGEPHARIDGRELETDQRSSNGDGEERLHGKPCGLKRLRDLPLINVTAPVPDPPQDVLGELFPGAGKAVPIPKSGWWPEFSVCLQSPTGSRRRAAAMIWSRRWTQCSTPIPTVIVGEGPRWTRWELPAALLEERLGGRSRHPGVLRQRGPHAHAAGGREAHGPAVDGAVCAAVACRAVASAGWHSGRSGSRNPTGFGDLTGVGEPVSALCVRYSGLPGSFRP